LGIALIYIFKILENGKVIQEIAVKPKGNTQLGAERVAKKYVGLNQTLRQKT
jgi:hypothetical protein|tara:strand:- start:1659 stop:1814 length:156 start_codon:yes stop_codon:yes gene_type:complete